MHSKLSHFQNSTSPSSSSSSSSPRSKAVSTYTAPSLHMNGSSTSDWLFAHTAASVSEMSSRDALKDAELGIKNENRIKNNMPSLRLFSDFSQFQPSSTSSSSSSNNLDESIASAEGITARLVGTIDVSDESFQDSKVTQEQQKQYKALQQKTHTTSTANMTSTQYRDDDRAMAYQAYANSISATTAQTTTVRPSLQTAFSSQAVSNAPPSMTKQSQFQSSPSSPPLHLQQVVPQYQQRSVVRTTQEAVVPPVATTGKYTPMAESKAATATTLVPSDMQQQEQVSIIVPSSEMSIPRPQQAPMHPYHSSPKQHTSNASNTSVTNTTTSGSSSRFVPSPSPSLVHQSNVVQQQHHVVQEDEMQEITDYLHRLKTTDPCKENTLATSIYSPSSIHSSSSSSAPSFAMKTSSGISAHNSAGVSSHNHHQQQRQQQQQRQYEFNKVVVPHYAMPPVSYDARNGSF
jgi:hypothetical protein